jgi:hypothetical protein
VVAGVAEVPIGRMQDEGYQALGCRAQDPVCGGQLVASQKGRAAEPRQGHTRRQCDATARASGELLLDWSAEGVSGRRSSGLHAAGPSR